MKYISYWTVAFSLVLSSLLLLSSCSSSKSSKYDISQITSRDFLFPIDTIGMKSAAISHVVRGSTLQNQGEYALSVIEFLDALRYDKSAGIYMALANSYRKLYKFDLAHEAITQAISLDPEFEPAYLLLVETLLPIRRYNDAIEILEFTYDKFGNPDLLLYIARVYEFIDKRKALEFYSEIPEDKLDLFTLFRIAELSQSLNDKVNEEKTLLKMTTIAPDNFHPHSALLEFYLENKKIKNAMDLLLNTEKKWNFDDTKSMYSQVGIYFLMNTPRVDTNQALRYLDKIDSRFQFDEFIQFVAGAVNQQIGDTTRADKHLTYLLQNAENDAFNPIEIAQVYVFSGRWHKAVEVLNNYENPNDDMRQPYFLGMAYMQYRDYDTAEAYMLDALRLSSNNADILGSLGYIYHELNDFDKSKKFYNDALQLTPESALLNNNFAYTLSEQDSDLHKALKMSEYALSIEPDNASYLDTYGWIMFKLEKYDKAVEYLLKALDKSDELTSEIFLHLVEVYIKMKDSTNAKKYIDMGLELFPDDVKLLEMSERIR